MPLLFCISCAAAVENLQTSSGKISRLILPSLSCRFSAGFEAFAQASLCASSTANSVASFPQLHQKYRIDHRSVRSYILSRPHAKKEGGLGRNGGTGRCRFARPLIFGTQSIIIQPKNEE